MAITHRFDYVKPGSTDEVLAVLAAHGQGASVLAGGTDLVGWIRDDLVAPAVVVDIKGVQELDRLEVRGEHLEVGALVTWNRLLESPLVRRHLPVRLEVGRVVASCGLRNRATRVGNFCSAVPCCDGGPVLLACEANVVMAGPSGRRSVPMGEWFLGPRPTALRLGELVLGLEIPLPPAGHGGCYVKLGRYRGEDLAQASVLALALPGREYRLAFGAVAPVPVRGARTEAFLKGRELDEATVAEASRLAVAEIAPITDIRASREYRAHMVGVMTGRALCAAADRLAGSGPPYGHPLL